MTPTSGLSLFHVSSSHQKRRVRRKLRENDGNGSWVDDAVRNPRRDFRKIGDHTIIKGIKVWGASVALQHWKVFQVNPETVVVFFYVWNSAL